MDTYTYEKIPVEMQSVPQWVLWRKVWREAKQKFDKIPIQVNGFGASITNPQHFSTYQNALFAHQMGVGDGIGFCFTPADDFVFVDLDGAMNCKGWHEDKLPILQKFATWGELSQSKKGVHFICKGKLDRAAVYNPAGLELYSANRFCAMTGWQLEDWTTDITEQQDAIDFLEKTITDMRGFHGTLAHVDAGPAPEMAATVPELEDLSISIEVYDFLTKGDASWKGDDRSRALMAAACSLYRVGLSDAEVLTILWQRCEYIVDDHRIVGNKLDWLWQYGCVKGRAMAPLPADEIDALITPVSGELIRASDSNPHADLMAEVARIDRTDVGCGHLAREVLIKAAQADAVTRIEVRSAVRSQMKWTKADLTTVEREIEGLISQKLLARAASNPSIYDNWVYIASQHAFMLKENRIFLRPEAFLARNMHLGDDVKDIALAMGGCEKVDALEFDPSETKIFTRQNGTYYNTWEGLADQGATGDISPYLRHMEAMIPDDEQRNHLLNWMAFTLQHPGKKINHCVLLSGSQGQGKDFLFTPITRALGRHAITQNANALLRDFNSYLCEAKLLTINEVDLGTRKEARTVANTLKSVIADPPATISINPKGFAEYQIRNVVHVVMFTNESQPVFLDNSDRRYFIVHSHYRVHNHEGARLPGVDNYFAKLWDWLDNFGGWQNVVGFLLSRDVTRFNPKAAPPMTESKQDIIDHSRSACESMLHAAVLMGIGPFSTNITESPKVYRWLLGEGSSLLGEYGIDRVPSIRAISTSLGNLGAVSERAYLRGDRIRLWNLAPLRQPNDISADWLQ